MPKTGNWQKGQAGEAAARAYLEQAGYAILAANYRCRFGEIDLIAKDKEYIIFVEVKCRAGDGYGHPCEAVTKKKQSKIIAVANQYIGYHNLQNQCFRFDVVEVYLENGYARVAHIPNAFW